VRLGAPAVQDRDHFLPHTLAFGREFECNEVLIRHRLSQGRTPAGAQPVHREIRRYLEEECAKVPDRLWPIQLEQPYVGLLSHIARLLLGTELGRGKQQ